jgi:hypothetical protein
VRVEDAELLTSYERKRQEYKERNRMSGKRETSTLEVLRSFRSKLAGAAQEPAEPDSSAAGESEAQAVRARAVEYCALHYASSYTTRRSLHLIPLLNEDGGSRLSSAQIGVMQGFVMAVSMHVQGSAA